MPASVPVVSGVVVRGHDDLWRVSRCVIWRHDDVRGRRRWYVLCGRGWSVHWLRRNDNHAGQPYSDADCPVASLRRPWDRAHYKAEPHRTGNCYQRSHSDPPYPAAALRSPGLKVHITATVSASATLTLCLSA